MTSQVEPRGQAYGALSERFRRISALSDAEAILHWDLATTMPKGGAAGRADQLATLRAIRHGLLTGAEVADQLEQVAGDTSLSLTEQTNIREMRRLHAHATALSASLVEGLSRSTSACETAWREAKAEDDFSLVRVALDDLLQRIREVAEAKSLRLGLSPYECLLDEYEPDGRECDIDRLFDPLCAVLADLLPQVIERQGREPAPLPPAGPFPIEQQRSLAVQFMERLGFDFDHGRLDVSLHPFCGGTPDDVRITTRYREDDFRTAFMGVMHETGHALYERGLPVAWRSQPIGSARGLVLHESQSLLIEMQVCRSASFLAFAAPRLRAGLNGEGRAWEADNLRRFYTRVQPSYIRVDADEVTYPLHVVLRYRLEKAMLAGELSVADLPGAWNDGVRSLLGLAPVGDRLGCLQDIHWYDGAWGYFPTYTLGAIAAAQIFQAALAADRHILPGIAAGDFSALLAWLRTNIHQRASSATTAQILTDATGSPLTIEPFLDHLRRRYLGEGAGA